jgi:hypothetical protein
MDHRAIVLPDGVKANSPAIEPRNFTDDRDQNARNLANSLYLRCNRNLE